MTYNPLKEECKAKGAVFTQLNHLNGAIYHLNALGFAELTPVLSELNRIRGSLLGQIKQGRDFQRINITMRTITGLSEGILRVWYELETGWFTEGRATPDSRPVYNQITNEQAGELLKNNPNVDLAHSLMYSAPTDVFN